MTTRAVCLCSIHGIPGPIQPSTGVGDITTRLTAIVVTKSRDWHMSSRQPHSGTAKHTCSLMAKQFPKARRITAGGCSSSAPAFADVRFQPASEMQQTAEPQWCKGAEVYGAKMLPNPPALQASLWGNVRALAPLQQSTQQPALATAEVTGVVAQLAETLTGSPESQRHQFAEDTHIVPCRQGCGAQHTPQFCAGTGLPHGQLGTASTGVASACSAVAHTDGARAGVPSLPPSCSKTGPAVHSKLLTAPQVQASYCQTYAIIQKQCTYLSRLPKSLQSHSHAPAIVCVYMQHQYSCKSQQCKGLKTQTASA
jgi:hypothetical protein